MRDLYRRLRVSPAAEPAIIEAALADQPDAELCRRVRGVLLVGPRRTAYDRVYPTLRQMAGLRERLGLEEGHWARQQPHSDFDGHPEGSARLRDPLPPPAPERSPLPLPAVAAAPIRARLPRWMLVLGAAALLVAAIAWALR